MSSEKIIINTSKAPEAIGPYNQAILAGGFLYISGQIPLHPETMELVSEDVKDQTHQVFKNLKSILEKADYNWEDVVKASVFIKDMDDFGCINEVYSEYFTKNQPARECVEVARLPKDVQVEISLIAWKDRK